MSGTSLRACLRCHTKKIKCTGYPACRGCNSAGVQCEPYKRAKKSETLEALKQAKGRVQWLEDQVYRNWGVECRNMPAGTPLQHSVLPSDREGGSVQPTELDASPLFRKTPGESAAPANDAPEISLVALNATGDMRYLGPSSGAFFAAYATSIARSLTADKDSWRQPFARGDTDLGGSDETANLTDQHTTLSSADVQLLLRSYEMWVHPLYPLLRVGTLRSLVEKCSRLQVAGNVDRSQGTEQNIEMAIFYLVMALGAINEANTVKQMQRHPGPGSIHNHLAQRQSPAYLYSRALHYFDCNTQHLRPSVATIQIVLLVSIYGSYGAIGSSQWQLAGLAMRMATEIGLHYSPKTWRASEQEINERSRVFWTAYAIEMSLAYNLGRPPSIVEEHITTALPVVTNETLFAVHYVKHRQIQSRIISQIYCGNNTAGQMSIDQKKSLICGLQAQLDVWRANIPTCQPEEASAYPQSYWDRLYHGTSFVLHRSSPLCPHPSSESLEKCIRSAGAYIDDMVKVLRNSNVPLSWMLVQGVLFAGLTLLITTRKGFQQLVPRTGMPFLLVDFPAWARKCSICLAIMNERWKEDLLSKLEAQFEILTNDSLHIISSGLTSQPSSLLDHPTSDQIQLAEILPSTAQLDHNAVVDHTAESRIGTAGDWEPFDMFGEVLGLDTMQSFWDMFPAELQDDESHHIQP